MRTPVIVAIIIIIAISLVSIGFRTTGPGTNPTATASPDSSNRTTMPTTAAQANPAAESNADWTSAHAVILKTDKGDIHLTLFPDKAPKTVTNFVTLGKRGYYDGIIFHRVIQDFVIQAGDPLGTGTGGSSIYGAKFEDEINDQKVVQGSLAMANAGPNTNGSQFYIVTKQAQPSLDGSYTVFGMTDPNSMSVVADIAATRVDGNDRPLTPIHITGFEITQP
jgi:cyclophilin family peptidyl-prolyl cis-trans isomerase